MNFVSMVFITTFIGLIVRELSRGFQDWFVFRLCIALFKIWVLIACACLLVVVVCLGFVVLSSSGLSCLF